MSSIRIGHLSDIHVWDDEDLGPLDFFTKRVTGWVNHRLSRAKEYDRAILCAAIHTLVDARPDMVVVSGDLSNLGLPSEFAAARRLLQPLLDAGIRVTAVPGNHDYYLPSNTRGRFEVAFSELQRADARLDGHVYPWLVRVGDVRVVHLNSAIATPPLGAWGRVGEVQRDATRRLVRNNPGGALVLVLHHHPVRAPHKRVEVTRELKDAAEVRGLCVELGADLVIHGHNHYTQVSRLGSDSGPLVYAISSATTNRTEPATRRAECAIYELDAGGVARISSWRWDAARAAFAGPTDVPLAGHTVVT